MSKCSDEDLMFLKTKFSDRFERSENMFLVAMRLGDTPVLIPNTMVKT